MKDVYILGIESSCDETSCAIVKNGCEEIATVISSQIDIHKTYGGVVPEIASREHVKNITIVIEECLREANMKMEEMDAIAKADKNCRLVKGHVFLWPGAKDWTDLWDMNGEIPQ